MEEYTGYDRYHNYDLSGYCGICSYVLFKLLRKMGYKPVLHMNDYHCFLTMDGYWIDLTLKQFNYKCPKVYLERKPYIKDDGYGNVHTKKYSAVTLKKIKKLFRGWPSDQNPFKQKLPKIKI